MIFLLRPEQQQVENIQNMHAPKANATASHMMARVLLFKVATAPKSLRPLLKPSLRVAYRAVAMIEADKMKRNAISAKIVVTQLPHLLTSRTSQRRR
jgi:hypothetical protein